MRVTLSKGAQRIWNDLKMELSRHGVELGELEEELSAIIPENSEVREIRAYGYRRFVGIFRRIGRLWILVEGDESMARELEKNLLQRIVKEVEDPKLYHRLSWALRGALRVTTVDNFQSESEIVRRVLLRCTVCGVVSGALLGIESFTCSAQVERALLLALAISGAAGYLLPWRAGLPDLAEETLERPNRVIVPTVMALTLMISAGLVSSLLVSNLGIGFLGVVIAAGVTGIAAARFVERVNREIVKVKR